jgi:hypothetical protein
MDRVTLTITSDLFDDNPQQEASVRANVTIRTLIEETRREFNLMEGNYILTPVGEQEPLPHDQTLEQLGVLMGSELVFQRERHSISQHMVVRGGHFFQPIADAPPAFVREGSSGTVFDIGWHPAIIGRPDATNPASGDMLAINLGDMEEARTVSRQHARILVQAGNYFLEPLAQRNPTFINDVEMEYGEKKRLKTGDKIRVGQVALTFHIQEN